MRGVCWVAWTALAVIVAGGRAGAEGLDGERFAPAAGAAGGLQVERPVVPAHLGYGVGLFLHLADDPALPGATSGKPIDRAVSADLLASLGLFNRAELAVHLPVRLIYKGDSTRLDGTTVQAAAGLGDLRLVPKMSFGWFGDERGGFTFGLATPISLPTGEASALRGSGGPTVEPRLLAGVYGRRWFLSGSGGFRFRSRDLPSAPGRELTFGLAATITALPDELDLQLEAVGGRLTDPPPAGFSRLPLEGLAAVIYRPEIRWAIYAGGGVGITHGPAVPDFRVLAGVRYAVGVPERGRPTDADNDGVPDFRDRCPRQREDLDGFEDDDGCPEADNDHDGVADDDDECPDDAEEPGGDGDGCPDRPRVVVRRGKMVIYGKVLFSLQSADLLPGNEALIDEMARALKDHPGIRKIEIEGHTDNTGTVDYNLKLSQERAEVVKRALERRQIAAQRLIPKGYGEDHPIAPNVTRAGRAKNRRVEFTILQD
jgi:outer membrane protein OmpA-like peptidoglycan-associated protein